MGKLTSEDCMCPICMCIFVEPVTMPCSHTLCMPCFKQNVEEASLTCPMCRTRISVWSRKATKSGTLINKKLWSEIKNSFPEKIEKRLTGEDDEDDEDDDRVYLPFISIAEPGEIRREYEEQMKRLEEQRQKEQQKEQEASEALIRKLQEEEDSVSRQHRQQLESIAETDNKLAQEIHAVIEEAGSDASFDFLIEQSKKRLTRSTSSVSSASCSSANSSRPASTIESFIHKMREAEKLKAADRVPGIKSPYPYTSYSPSAKVAKSPSVNALSSRSTSTSKCSNLGYDLSDLQCEDEGLFSEHLAKEFSKSDRGSSHRSSVDVEIISYAGMKSKRKCETVGKSPFIDLSETPDLEIVDIQMNASETVKSPEIEMLTSKLVKDATIIIPDSERCESRKLGSKLSGTESSQSNDSIAQELTHFKPIKVCPLTPPKKLPSGKVMETHIIRTTPRNLSKTGFSPSQKEKSLSDIDASSPIMQRRLSELGEERKIMVRRMSKSTNVSNENSLSPALDISPSGDRRMSLSSPGEKSDNSLRLDDASSYEPSESKKLMIPLESNIDELLDFDIPPPLSVNNNINNIEQCRTIICNQRKKNNSICSDNSKKVVGKRKINVSPDPPSDKKTSRLKSDQSPFSPQRSIRDWMIKGSKSCNSAVITSNLHCETVCMQSCRDEVDGSTQTAVGSLNSNLNKIRTLDRFVSKVTNDQSVLNFQRKTRIIKKPAKLSEDFVYLNLSPKKKEKKNMILHSEDEDCEDSLSDTSSVTEHSYTSVDSIASSTRGKRKLLFSTEDSSKRRKTSNSKQSSNAVVGKRKKLKSSKNAYKRDKIQKGKELAQAKGVHESRFWKYVPIDQEFQKTNAETGQCEKVLSKNEVLTKKTTKDSKFWKYVPVDDCSNNAKSGPSNTSCTESAQTHTVTSKGKVKESRFWKYVPVGDVSGPTANTNCNETGDSLHSTNIDTTNVKGNSMDDECQQVDTNCNIVESGSREISKSEQEALDEMLAKKLFKQFELEKRYGVKPSRFKGGDDAYNLRGKS